MELRISSPCPKSWDELVGDDKIRYCGQCRLNVYNLAEMPKEEVEALVRKTEGRLCGRLYMRGDKKAAHDMYQRALAGEGPIDKAAVQKRLTDAK